MFDEILKGESPTAIFRRLIEADTSIGNIRLGEMLGEEFPKLTGEVEQLIWHWKGPGKSQGLSDGDPDALLRKLFAKAGYM